MFIHTIAHYIPSMVLENKFFSELTCVAEEDILKKTGIKERRKAGKNENTNTMGIEAVRLIADKTNFSIPDIDLIIGGTYTPYDTIGTFAHSIQKHFKIADARVISISTACSSFVNSIEIAEGYFATGKAKNALIVVSEHNSGYNDEKDPVSGYLWGDGAAAIILTKNKISENDIEILDVYTQGLGNIGKGPDGVCLKPNADKLKMPHGKDVFSSACKYMTQAVTDILKKNKLQISDMNYLIPHQANIRIINVVAENLKITSDKIMNNLEFLGNTGCAGAAIVLSQNWHIFKKNDIIVISVFGGGYSMGAVLLKK